MYLTKHGMRVYEEIRLSPFVKETVFLFPRASSSNSNLCHESPSKRYAIWSQKCKKIMIKTLQGNGNISWLKFEEEAKKLKRFSRLFPGFPLLPSWGEVCFIMVKFKMSSMKLESARLCKYTKLWKRAFNCSKKEIIYNTSLLQLLLLLLLLLTMTLL